MYISKNKWIDFKKNTNKNIIGREFPGGPVVKTLCFHCWGLGSIPGGGTKILQAERLSQKNKKEENKNIIGDPRIWQKS